MTVSTSAFEKALSAMTADERARAQRLRDGLKLREDDALWAYCGIIRGFETILQEIPTKCAEAAEQAMRSEIASLEPNAKPNEPSARDPNSSRILHIVTLGSLYVTCTVLFGCSAFTLGTILLNGQTPWIPTTEAPPAAFILAVSAILNAPVGGLFVLLGLMNLGLMAAALRYVRAPRPHAAR
jgi:hypothetical protein